tara:strand:- start:1276 stop:1476 length:201 start_codon:yes stop_codon:yes gene_type:complete
MKDRKIKVQGAPAGPSPKAQPFADIEGQGKIPYGKTADVKVPTKTSRLTARGMGAAKRGGSYIAMV